MSSAEFPIVGIGASAGGIDAFHRFFEQMPADCGMAFVLILHLPAHRKSMLTEIMARWTSMPVIEVANSTPVRANHVYLPKPHTLVTLTDGHLNVQMPAENSERMFSPIDGFFDSLGIALRERAVGIVLSGTGSDGALGLKALKECGGLTLAQGRNGSAPQYGEMPDGAIATGAVDIVAPVEEMAGHLLRLARTHVELPRNEAAGGRSVEAARLEICTLLRTHVGHDFSGYRSQTFLRRVRRRMQVVNARTLTDYVATLKADPQEIPHLFRDLLIRVTSFFRDQETFEVLAAKVIPRLFDGKMADGTVRVWVPGCATGEEAYSLAILLREHMDTLSAQPKVQLFATDIDDSAISTARHGRYPKTLVEGLSADRLRRFFHESHAGYSVTKEIRELCTFSVHNVIRDPPFSMMNLVSCRNLLIYMNPELQDRVIPVFHYSLVPGGILLLGGSESVAQHPKLFETLDKSARIFQRREGPSRELQLPWPPRSPVTPGNTAASDNQPPAAAFAGRNPTMSQRATRKIDNQPALRFEHLLQPADPSAEIVGQLQAALLGNLPGIAISRRGTSDGARGAAQRQRRAALRQ